MEADRHANFTTRLPCNRDHTTVLDGIRRVEVSVDGGNVWQAVELGPDLGRFAFRSWTYRFTPQMPGKHTISARASNAIGQTQAESLIFNPAGYHNNVVRPLAITAA